MYFCLRIQSMTAGKSISPRSGTLGKANCFGSPRQDANILDMCGSRPGASVFAATSGS